MHDRGDANFTARSFFATLRIRIAIGIAVALPLL
jgi:hypothetical protein